MHCWYPLGSLGSSSHDSGSFWSSDLVMKVLFVIMGLSVLMQQCSNGCSCASCFPYGIDCPQWRWLCYSHVYPCASNLHWMCSKFPKLTKFCNPSTVCLGWHAKTSPRCTEYPGLELLSLSLQTSLWEEALWRHLQELPAAALRHRPGRCLWCSWSVWLQAAQSRPCCFISPQGTALHPTDVTCCSIPACACHIAFSPHGVTSVSL